MYAEKLVRVEFSFDTVHRFADHMRLSARMKLYVVTRCFDPFDLVGFEKKHSSRRFYNKPFEIFLFVFEVREQGKQTLIHSTAASVLDLFAGTANCPVNSLAGKRFE